MYGMHSCHIKIQEKLDYRSPIIHIPPVFHTAAREVFHTAGEGSRMVFSLPLFTQYSVTQASFCPLP